MNSFQNPVTPPDPFDRYRIEKTGSSPEKSKKNVEDFSPSSKEKWFLTAYFLKILHAVLQRIRPSRTKSLDERAKATLARLKNCFEILKKEDRSEDIEFLQELSLLWHEIVTDSTLSKQCKDLLKKIQIYPEYATYSLGYYLTEYAGRQWIPFPFMELIRKIHTEYEKNPDSSPLTLWNAHIEELLKAD